MLVDLASFLYKRNRLGGFHHGEVVDNEDPDKKGHIKCIIPNVLEGGKESLPWIAPKYLSFGGLSDTQVFSVPKIGASVLVEFENPYCLYYTAWTPTDKSINDLFHDDYPDRYGMQDGEFLVLMANRRMGDVVLAKRTTTGETTLAYLGPESEVDLATAGKIDVTSAENTINIRARRDLNLETEAGDGAEGSVFRIRGTLLVDTYDGLTIKSNGANLTVDTGGGGSERHDRRRKRDRGCWG